MRKTELAEILWNVRRFLEDAGRRRDDVYPLRSVETLVAGVLRNYGVDPGKTAADADDLKLELIQAGDDSGKRGVAVPPPGVTGHEGLTPGAPWCADHTERFCEACRKNSEEHARLLSAASAQDVIADCLEKVARLDNSDATPHRTVGRWAEFVNRAVLGPRLVADDALLPVRKWVKARKVDTGDYVAMAKAFVDWTREANAAFETERRR